MEKKCPDCGYELTKQDYRQYLKDQVGDWIICNKCHEKFYILVPESGRMKMGIQKFLLVLLAFALAVAIVVAFAFISPNMVGDEFTRRDMRLLGVVAFGAVGALYIVLTKGFRHIYWKHAQAQKSPFTS